MIPSSAIVPPRMADAERAVRKGQKRPSTRRWRTRAAARKQIAHSANVAQYWAGERIVIASRVLDAGANTSYRKGVRRVAAAANAGLATSISGGKEKTAVTISVAVITSGHRYRDRRRSFSVCKSLVKEVRSHRRVRKGKRITCRYDDTICAPRGNVTTTLVPFPGSDETAISAPCSLAIQLAIERPSPAPSVLLRAVSPRKKR